MNLRLLILFASMAGLLIIEAVNSTVLGQINIPKKAHEELILNQLQQYAKSITVKVISSDSWGSGVIIQRKGKIYLVVTSEHVLSRGKLHSIQVADGSIYSTNLLPSIGSNDDLGLMQFYSPTIVYPVAVLKQISISELGNRVFAAGFPFDINLSKSGKFEFTTGKIYDLLKQPLIGGYQIGYTNNVKRGMSGGPLLDIQGKVVAINGMPKYPLLGNPYVFKDGSTVSEARWQEMSHLSWAVPISMFLHLL
jgi:S1-C subfamily serine protease